MEQLIRHRVTNDLSERFSINVTRRNGGNVEAHWHDFYEIELFLDGNGKSSVNGREYDIVPGTLFFLTPTDYHSIQTHTRPRIVNLTFAPYCIEYSEFSELLSLTHSLYAVLNAEETERMLSLIELIEREGKKERFLNQKYASHLLACVLIEILRLRRETKKQETVYDLPMQKLIYYVHSHFKENITLESVSEFVELSPGYVSKLFRKNLGIGFCELLTKLRLKHAENLLIHSGESITDIAFFCGFRSPSHFLRCFLKYSGMSPRQFRKNYAKSEENKVLSE